MSTTGAAIILAAKERADLVGSGFISDAEWLRYVNGSCAELHDLLIGAFGADYKVQSTAGGYLVTTDGLTSYYALPADFYKLLGADLLISGSGESGTWQNLKPFNFSERNRYTGAGASNYPGRTNLRYRLNGSNLWLQPLPVSGLTVRVFYAPLLAALDGTGGVADTFAGFSGWDEYAIVDAAIKGKVKAEEDPSALMAQKQALLQRIAAAAENRDAGSPATVVDVTGYGRFEDGPEGW